METPPSFIESPAEAVIQKCFKAMDAIWEDHCKLMVDTDVKLKLLNMTSFVPDPSRDDAEGDQALADLRKALDNKESEIQSLKSQLKVQFHDYQWKMSEKVVEVVDLKRDGRALNMRLINTQRKAASAKRRMCREMERRVALTRSNNLLQQTNESLVVKSRTSKLECDNFKGMYNELQDSFESSLSEYSSLKRRFDDSQVEYDSLRSEHDSLREEHHNSQLRYRELEEAHENSKLEYQKREEELQGSIAELKEALNLTNAAGVDDDRVKARLEVPLRRQSKELKKTKVNFKKQVSQLKSSLKRKAEGFCELQMVIEEAERAVNTRDQRISDLEAALRKTAEELSQARAEVEVVKGLTGQQLESEGEQMELFNGKSPTHYLSSEPNIYIEEGDNIETDGEGNSTTLGVPIVDYFNDAMVDAPSRPFSKSKKSPRYNLFSVNVVRSPPTVRCRDCCCSERIRGCQSPLRPVSPFRLCVTSAS
jgi:chromosome segregation ATPase